MKVSECSRRSSTPIDTIRYYEKIDLLNVVKEEHSQKDYSDKDVERLCDIAILKKTNLSLDEIRDYLRAKDTIESMLSGNLDFAKIKESLTTLKTLNDKLNEEKNDLLAAQGAIEEAMNSLKENLLK